MIYEIKNNDILVYDKTQFNPKHILECGQVFRFGIDENQNYYVISKDKKATIIESDDYYIIKSNDPKYFVKYFDLNRDYNLVKSKLSNDPILKPMIKHGYGIRILNADPLEMIFSFVISQNNNIKRIQKIVENLCKIGATCDGFNAFPTIKELCNQDESFFKSLGAGYRDKFLHTIAHSLKNANIEEIKNLSSEELYEFLLSLHGIGPKVASCILLFGFGKTNKFPVDTWLEQVYYNHYETQKRTRKQIQQYFEEKYGEYSGIAQQYLFYFEREKN